MERKKHLKTDEERPIFGPAASLFVGHSPIGGCSLLTPRIQPKSLAAPSAPICEMASWADFSFYVAAPETGAVRCKDWGKRRDAASTGESRVPSSKRGALLENVQDLQIPSTAGKLWRDDL